MDKYKITRSVVGPNDDPSFQGIHVTFRLAQRGQQMIGYTPPSWISKDPNQKRYLLNILDQ